MKRFYFLLILILIPGTLLSQEFSVKSFYLAETDLTANTQGTMVHDQNGNPCALIKVETTLNGYTFDVGVLGVSEVKRVGGEIWVYIPFGVRKITISHPELGVIRNYAFNTRIDKGRTYILQLNAKVGNRTYDSRKKQKVILSVSPKTAEVEINGITQQHNQSGKYELSLSLGVHDLLVSNNRYHTIRDQIAVNNPDSTLTVNLELKPTFGWVTFNCNNDEILYLNDQETETNGNEALLLDSGHYRIVVKKALHESYNRPLEVKDGESYTITPTFKPRYRELEFQVNADAEIWINGAMEGCGVVSRKFEYGRYNVECKLPKHASTNRTVLVDSTTTGPIILDSPKPLFREINFHTDEGVDIFINGVKAGTETAKKTLDFGTYEIECRKHKHKSTYSTLTIDSTTTANSITLESPIPLFREYIINTDKDVEIWIDSTKVGVGPMKYALDFGTYLIEGRMPYHRTTSQTIISDPKKLIDSIYIEKPTPILSEINFNSKPSNAEVYIDNNIVGYTPCIIPIIIGPHKVKIDKKGYQSYNQDILLAEGQREVIDIQLSKAFPLSIRANEYANIYIDNKKVTRGYEYSGIVTSGLHRVKIQSSGFKTINKLVMVNDRRNNEFVYTLKDTEEARAKRHKRWDEWNSKTLYHITDNLFGGAKVFEVGATFQPAIGASNFGVEGGMYFRRIYVGLNFLRGLSKTEEVEFIDDYIAEDYLINRKLKSRAGYLKLGHLFTPWERLQLMPFLCFGAQALLWDLTPTEMETIKETYDYSETMNYNFTLTSSFGIGLKASYAIVKCIEATISAGYYYATGNNTDLTESPHIFQAAYDQVPTTKRWGNGFKVNFGISFYI